MSKLWIAALALTLGAAAAPAKTTLTGELVDLGCYLGHGGAGAKHAPCAKMCVKNGQPLGLLSKGALYLVVGGHDDEKPLIEAKEHAGENVKLTGKLLKKDGMQAILVEKVEKE